MSKLKISCLWEGGGTLDNVQLGFHRQCLAKGSTNNVPVEHFLFEGGYPGQCLAEGSVVNVQVENFLCTGEGGGFPGQCLSVLQPDKITGANQYQRSW